MDRGSRISRSSDSSGDSSSSTGSFAPISESNDEKASGEVTSPTPQDLRVELSRLKMTLASHEHTLVERSNHLSRLAGEVDSKDHQLALANRQIQLRDRRIAELERQLADVYKSRAQEAYGEHAKARLLVDTERECRQLRRRCQFWRSRALGKSRVTGNTSRSERSD
jgi:chromosome segregation ATPase